MADSKTRERDRVAECMKDVLEKYHFKCITCDGPLELDVNGDAWLAGAKTIPPTSQVSILHCVKCNGTTCAGCGKEPKFNENSYWTSLGVVNHCCDGGKAFGVSYILSQVDNEYMTIQLLNNATATPSKPSKPKSKSKKHTLQPGVGYTSDSLVLAGFGLNNAFNSIVNKLEDSDLSDEAGEQQGGLFMARPKKAVIAEPKTDPMDTTLMKAMKLLIPFLPANADDVTILQKSVLLDRLLDLARNDSIADIVERQELYQSMYDFVGHIANSGLACLVFEERGGSPSWFACSKNTFEQAKVFLKLASKSEDVPEKLQDSHLKSSSFHQIRVGKPSQLTNNLNQMISHAKAQAMHTMLDKTAPGPSGDVTKYGSSSKVPSPLKPPYPIKHRERVPVDHKANAHSDRVNAQSTLICRNIVDLYQLLARHAENPSLAHESIGGEWNKFWENNKLTFSEDVLVDHFYYRPGKTVSSTPARNRSNTINKEIAIMCTSLPYGVFLKVSESHTDVMKILIVGVEGTPYAGGLFTFDMILPPNYPNAPPKMAFVLENVDEDRSPLNPNLHIGGQVCLSLLNTWDGSPEEMWQPGKSTILAVLVSIQAMILGAPIPWLNEPGMEFGSYGRESKLYSSAVECKTVKYGMIQWLQKLQAMTGTKDIWRDVNEAYWKSNSDNVLAIVKQWSRTNNRIEDYSPEENINPLAPHQGKASRGKKKAGSGENLLTALINLISPDAAALLDTVDERSKPASEESLPDAKRVKTDSDDSFGAKWDISHLSGTFTLPNATFTGLGDFKYNKITFTSKAPEKTWFYTGPHKLADVRAACEDLGVKPAISIQKTIDRLEEEVNVNGFGTPEALRWGETR